MSVAIPYFDSPGPLEARVSCLAGFLGVESELVSLPADPDAGDGCEGILDDFISPSCDAIAITPELISSYCRNSSGNELLPSSLLQRFRYIIVHGLQADADGAALVNSLSEGQLTSVLSIDSDATYYSIAGDERSVCGPFSGLKCARSNAANDHVLQPAPFHPGLRTLITIGDLPLMAIVKTSHAEVLFIGSSDVADVDAEMGPEPLNDYFSRLIPHAMALRYIGGDTCWHPMTPKACFVIDDPLLRTNYGFLNFDSLLQLALKHRFHASIAFIPHNFERNAPRVIAMFRDNAAQLSICFHGNDHTRGEFAATDPDFLNAALKTADERMRKHYRTTGLTCDRVMVFPQGLYSTEAMDALQRHNFWAAVNTSAVPQRAPFRPKLRDLLQPAVLRSANFPLFIRRHIGSIDEIDIAFNCFFGKPTLIVTHHEIYADPKPICELADKINRVAQEVEWCNLASVASKSYLTRRVSPEAYRIQTYSPTVSITNDSDSWRTYTIEWMNEVNPLFFSHVLVGSSTCNEFSLEGSSLRATVKLASGVTEIISARFQPENGRRSSLGFAWRARAYARRRLSELRDNRLSKNPAALNAAKAFQRRFLRI